MTRGARSLSAHCEVGSRLAARLGLGDGVVGALAHAYERWDGRGIPDGLAGEAIPVAVRVVVVARDAVLLQRLPAQRSAGGAAAAPRAGLRPRRGGRRARSRGAGRRWPVGVGGHPRGRAGARPTGRRRRSGSGAGRGGGLRGPAVEVDQGPLDKARRARAGGWPGLWAAGIGGCHVLRRARWWPTSARVGVPAGCGRFPGRWGWMQPSGSGCTPTSPSASWAAVPGCARWPCLPGHTMNGSMVLAITGLDRCPAAEPGAAARRRRCVDRAARGPAVPFRPCRRRGTRCALVRGDRRSARRHRRAGGARGSRPGRPSAGPAAGRAL